MSRFLGDLRGDLLTCTNALHAIYVSEARAKSDQKDHEERPQKLYICIRFGSILDHFWSGGAHLDALKQSIGNQSGFWGDFDGF